MPSHLSLTPHHQSCETLKGAGGMNVKQRLSQCGPYGISHALYERWNTYNEMVSFAPLRRCIDHVHTSSIAMYLVWYTRLRWSRGKEARWMDLPDQLLLNTELITGLCLLLSWVLIVIVVELVVGVLYFWPIIPEVLYHCVALRCGGAPMTFCFPNPTRS